MLQTTDAYATAATDYLAAGWSCVLPVPPATKTPPPIGFTGATGRDTTADDVARFAEQHPRHSVALRMPEGVIGIDVDHYPRGDTNKRGDDDLRGYVAQWGELPATWSSTARGNGEGPGRSRIMFYRVPAGRYGTTLGSSIEIIQRHHRYAVVAPSFNGSAGSHYEWYALDGTPSSTPPGPADLAELPLSWVTGLREAAAGETSERASSAEGTELLSRLLADTAAPCRRTQRATQRLTGDAWDEGCRHDTVIRRSHELVRLGAEGHRGISAALETLRELWYEATDNEHRESEFERAVRSAAEKAVTAIDGAELPDPCVTFEHTEQGAAERVHHHAGDRLAWTPETGWHAYTAGRWETSADHIAFSECQRLRDYIEPDLATAKQEQRRLPDTVAEMLSEKEAARKKDLADWIEALEKHRSRVQSSRFKEGVLKELRPLCVRKADEFDQHTELFNVDNGTLELHSNGDVALREHRSADLLTMGTDVPYDPAATAPFFIETLTRAQPDENIRRYLHKLLGYGLLGGQAEQIFILNVGTESGSNLKSTVMEAVRVAVGEYHATLRTTTLEPSHRGSSDAAPDLMELRGKRFAIATEVTSRLDAEKLKAWTGGELITARQLHQKDVTFRPDFLLIISANGYPTFGTEGAEGALQRRIRYIPWTYRIPDAERLEKDTVDRRLADEAPGILAWLVEGYKLYRQEGLADVPPECSALQDKVVAEFDWLGNFLTETVEPCEGGFITKGELWRRFDGYRKGDPELVGVRKTEFHRKVGDRLITIGGVPRKDRLRGHGWADVKLASDGRDQPAY